MKPLLAAAFALCAGLVYAEDAVKSTVEPATIAFTEQGVGRTSPVQVLTYKAGADAKSRSLRLKATGEFAVAPEHCEPIGPTTPCSVTVTFSPKKAGKSTGAITVVDGEVAWPSVSLSGTGTCGVDWFRNASWYLAGAAILYVIGFMLARWHLIAQPTRNLLLAQLDAVKARMDSRTTTGIPAALKDLLTQAYETVRRDTPAQFLFWSRGNEIAAWSYVHKVEELLVHYQPQAEVRVGMEEAAAELRQANVEPGLTLAAKMEEELHDIASLTSDQRAVLMDAEKFFKSIPGLLPSEIKAFLAQDDDFIDGQKLDVYLSTLASHLRERAKLIEQLQALFRSEPATGAGTRVLIDDLLAKLDAQSSTKLQTLEANIAKKRALEESRRVLAEAAGWLSMPEFALQSRIASVLAANYAAPIDRWRALLAEGLGLLYDRKDVKFATLMTWHNKTAWLLACAILLIIALALTLDNAMLLLVGAAGGLLSRLSRTVYGADVPTDYGASWTTLFLSPVIGALSAWGGILIIALGVQLNVFGSALGVDWCNACNACNATALALALMLGFSERFFDQILKPLQDKIVAQQATAPALKITTPSQLKVAKDQALSTKLIATGGAPPYKWASIGALPVELKLDEKSGELSGKVIVTSPTTFGVQVTDSKGAVATQTLTLEAK